ncbi:MAG: type II toxin-antitoxin system MqsA family antitoxin [Actinobacteria bacterium]|nr:type II toxin-antitoxin system MqsA family antitoxin [Actinomycetota bacterium]
MTCPICGQGQLEDGTTTFAADIDGAVVVVRAVPGKICDVCGEAFIDEHVSDELETIVEDARGTGTESLVRHYQPVAS